MDVELDQALPRRTRDKGLNRLALLGLHGFCHGCHIRVAFHRRVGGRHRHRIPQRIASKQGLVACRVGEQIRPSQGQRDGHRCRCTGQLHAERNDAGFFAEPRSRRLRRRSVHHFRSGGQWFWHSDLACHERDAGVAKRLEHAFKLGIGHEADLLVFLAVQLAQSRKFHRGPDLQLLLEVHHQGFDGLQSFGIHHAALRHEFVGDQAVVGGQPRIEKDVAGGGDNLAFGLVVPSRSRIAHKPSQAGKHHAIVIPKHARQHAQHIAVRQRGRKAQ